RRHVGGHSTLAVGQGRPPLLIPVGVMASLRGTRPATSLRVLCETADDLGIGLDVALAGTGLTAADLDDATTEVTAEQEMRAVENIASAYPGEAGLGLAVGRRLHVNSFGIWGFAVLTSPTFRAAIETAIDHIRLSYVFSAIEFREDHDVARLVFDLSGLAPAVHAYVLERHSVVTMHFSREVVDTKTLGEFRVETTRRSRYATALSEHLGLEVVADAEHDALVFPSRVLGLPVPRSDPSTLRYCLEQCELLTARLDDDTRPWSTQVRDVLVEDISDDHQIGATAKRLAVNERTLRRRLAEEGTTFREVYTDTRLSIARELLETAGLSVESVSRRVGYAEPASFVRSFARHYGTTPGRVRRPDSR
ncbi:MAG: AraC family transcriptional regulator ligand-binding domain-containing protein, partial [Actinomycetota bacterium]